tara:strand:+ start:870 stop:1220 length:351 start_codon:yes stop_codon:yes gene_type:complete
MRTEILRKIETLINSNKLSEAQNELSKLGKESHTDPDYLYLRSKIFYLNKLYYIAIDTLLISLEFKKDNKVYDLISKIYDNLDNKELSKKFSDLNIREETANLLKDELSGIYRKNK